jgi:AcrR family transcriptional regulator
LAPGSRTIAAQRREPRQRAFKVPRIVDHDRRREEIARLAVRVIQRDGAESATVRGIASAGGFSIGVLSHYFRDKDELVGFAFQWLAHQSFADLDAAVASAPPGLARLRTALEFMVPATAAPSFIRVWLSLWGGAMRNPALARVHRAYYKPAYDAIIVGGGGHGLATAYYLARNHGMTECRRARERLAGRRQHGPQHDHRPLQLPSRPERPLLRAVAQVVGALSRISTST